MIWFVALAASAASFSPPVPTTGRALASSYDVPVQLMMSERLYAVTYRAIVDPSGKLRECEIERSSGDRKVDAYTCLLVKRRGKYFAARNENGEPTFGVHRETVQWWTGEEAMPKGSFTDIELSVIELPKGVKSPALVQVMFAVDAQGEISSCALGPEAGEEYDERGPPLAQAACESIRANFKASPVRDGAGNFVPSIQNGTVRFTAAR